ncbi:MAG TPA: hypothetical protein VL128_01990 [Candidatus Eisenbacteria bacterium]|nr:hypothetical protein [Candidatus Eisenbacteria bacterium]
MAQDGDQEREYPHQANATNGEQTTSATEESSLPSNGDQNKTSSPAKIAASRGNGKRSNGPTSPEGKAKSSRNSYKHGFFARQPLPPGEAGAALWGAYQDLVAGIWGYYKPVGYLEGLLTEKIATESIRFSRLLTFERELTRGINLFNWNGLDRLLRYQGTINRQLFQAMRELERMQERRKAETAPTGALGGLADSSTGTLAVVPDSSLFQADSESPSQGAAISDERHLEFCAWEQIPLIIAPRQGNGGQNSEASRAATNYGTNPTPSSFVQPPKAALRKDTAPPKPSLADKVTKALDLPPMQNPLEGSSPRQEETGASIGKKAVSDDIAAHPKFIEPEDRARLEQVQESIRNEGNGDIEDSEDSS